jgi:hypothetical protein
MMEMVLKLQEQGEQVEIVLIDGSLASLQALARTGVTGGSPAEWESNFLEKLMMIVGVADPQKVTIFFHGKFHVRKPPEIFYSKSGDLQECTNLLYLPCPESKICV